MKRKEFLIASAVLLLLCASSCTKQTALQTNAIAPAPIPNRISTEDTDAAEPAIAAARDGSLLVVWVEHRKDGQGDVFLRKTNSAGAQPNVPIRINPDVGRATAWRGDPPTISVAPDGTIYVAWTSRAADKGHENNLYLSTSRNGAATFEAPVKINDDQKPAVHGMHSMTIDSQGRIHFAWLDERNLRPSAPTEKHRGEAHAMESNREVFTAYSEDGGRTISRNQLIAREACPCCKTAVTTSPDGKVYVGWRQVLKGDLRHIAVASSADNGRTFSSPVIVSDDKWVIAGCPVSGPSLSARKDGALRVLWYTEGESGTRGLYTAQSTDGGRTFSPRQLVAGGPVFGNPVLVPDSRLDIDVAIWQAGDNGLVRAEITQDGNVQANSTVMTTGKLPSATIANGRSVLAYISHVNNQQSIWLIVASQIELGEKQ